MRLALYQPDIPQNTGAVLRLGACFGVAVDIVEPCGFLLDSRQMRRAAMDYIDLVDWTRHSSWEAYLRGRKERAESGRIVLLTTRATTGHTGFRFAADDTLLLGRESAGVPDDVHAAADARLRVPIRAEARSLNLASAAAIVLGEALRQTGAFENLRQTGAFSDEPADGPSETDRK